MRTVSQRHFAPDLFLEPTVIVSPLNCKVMKNNKTNKQMSKKKKKGGQCRK